MEGAAMLGGIPAKVKTLPDALRYLLTWDQALI